MKFITHKKSKSDIIQYLLLFILVKILRKNVLSGKDIWKELGESFSQQWDDTSLKKNIMYLSH